MTRRIAPAVGAVPVAVLAALPCVQAVASQPLTMYRFDDQDDAVAAARYSAGEAHLSGWIVVRFEPGGLPAQRRRDVVTGLDCIDVGTTSDGIEC